MSLFIFWYFEFYGKMILWPTSYTVKNVCGKKCLEQRYLWQRCLGPKHSEPHYSYSWKRKQPATDGMLVFSPKSVYWNPTSQCHSTRTEGIGKWSGHGRGTLIKGISACERSSRELARPFLDVKAPGEDSCLWPGSRHRICCALILNFLDSRTGRKKCLLFNPPSLCYFCDSSLS